MAVKLNIINLYVGPVNIFSNFFMRNHMPFDDSVEATFCCYYDSL